MKQHIKHEHKCCQYKRISPALQGTNCIQGGLKRIDITAAETSEPYNQAASTPFGSGYLAEIFGLNASTDFADQLLKGTFNPDLSPVQLPKSVDMIKQLGQTLKLQQADVSAEITPEQFVSTYKIVKEATSSSPSGKNVSH